MVIEDYPGSIPARSKNRQWASVTSKGSSTGRASGGARARRRGRAAAGRSATAAAAEGLLDGSGRVGRASGGARARRRGRAAAGRSATAAATAGRPDEEGRRRQDDQTRVSGGRFFPFFPYLRERGLAGMEACRRARKTWWSPPG